MTLASAHGARSQDPIPARPEPLLQSAVEPFRVPYDAVVERRLDNGVTLVAVEDPTLPLVDVAIALGVGGALEDSGVEIPGVASMTATMLRRGGTSSLSPAELDALSEFRGIRINSFGGRHRSGVVASGSPADFDQLSAWSADVLLRPGMDGAEVERLRDNGLRSLGLRWSTEAAVADREWTALVLGRRHPRARPLRSEDLQRWTPAALAAFHRRHYRPERTVVAVAGGVPADVALRRYEELLGPWRASPPEDDPALPDDAPEDTMPAEPGLYQLVRDVPQGVLVLGHAGYRRTSWSDAQADAAEVLSEILGGPGAVSRLRGRLRDRDGLVYTVSGSVGVGSAEPGLVRIALQVAPERALEALAAVLEEVERLRRLEPPRGEMDLARRGLVESLPSLFDTAEEIAGRYAEDVLLGRPHDFWQRYPERIRRVGPGDVRDAAVRLLRPQDLRVVWVGPELPRRALRELGFERVRRLPERDPLSGDPVD